MTMGCIKGLKKAAKAIRRELTPIIMEAAGNVVVNAGVRIADGEWSKDDARKTGQEALQLVYGIGGTAAGVAIELAHEAVNKLQTIKPIDLRIDDSDDEAVDLVG